MDDLLQEMIQPAGPTAHDRARRRRLIASAATVGLAVVGVTSLTTSALFSDNDAVSGSGFTTGSVDITKTPLATVLVAPNMAPGDTVYGPVTVTNSGSLAFRYAVGYFFTDTDTTPGEGTGLTGPSLLSSQLSLSVHEVAAPENCSPLTGPIEGSTRLADVPVGTAVTADNDIIGTRGSDGGGHGELVLQPSVGDSDDFLCVGVGMSVGAGNEYQQTTADLTLTFYAEQTANNP